jgi:hypothetical protein
MYFMESLLSRALSVAAATCLFGLAAASALANTVTYDFTYSGTGTFVNETVTGSGSFTADFTPGMTTGTLDAFSFTDTFTGADGTSTFDYTSATGSIKFAASSPFALTNVTLQTPYVLGTNSAFGSADFVLNYSGVTFDSTSEFNTVAADSLADASSGGGSIALTPEPSSAGILGLAVLALGICYRSRRRASAELVPCSINSRS